MRVHLALSEEHGIWVAQSIEFDVCSQGATPEKAVAMWHEAARIHVEELGQLPQWEVVEVGFEP